MGISVTTTGSGAFADGTTTDNLVSVQVDVASSPLLLGDYSGGSTTMSAVAKANTSASSSNSQVMIENTITVTDDVMGSMSGKVNGVSIDPSEMVTLNGATIVSYLDIDFEAETCSGFLGNPIGPSNSGAWWVGSGPYTLKNALTYYFSGINLANGTTLDYSGLTANPVVNIPSWSGNLLQRIKEMCAIYRMRFWASDNTFYFADLSETVIDSSHLPIGISSSTTQPAQSVAITNYNTSFLGGSTNNAILYYDEGNIIEIEANSKMNYITIETPNVDIVTVGSLSVVDPGVAFQQVTQQQYNTDGTGFTRPANTSFFSIIDANGNPIPAAAWTAAGAYSLINNGPGYVTRSTEISIAIQAPTSLEFISVFPGPYKLAVEDLTGNIVSSLFIVGAGLARNPSTQYVAVGKASSNPFNNEYDSPFVYDALTETNANYYAAAYEARPNLTANFSDIATRYQFSNIDTVSFVHNYNKYKVDTASITYPNISVSAQPATSIADLDAVWTGSTIATLDAKISGYTISDWSSIPLVR
jgi:hypothetical protein